MISVYLNVQENLLKWLKSLQTHDPETTKSAFAIITIGGSFLSDICV